MLTQSAKRSPTLKPHNYIFLPNAKEQFVGTALLFENGRRIYSAASPLPKKPHCVFTPLLTLFPGTVLVPGSITAADAYSDWSTTAAIPYSSRSYRPTGYAAVNRSMINSSNANDEMLIRNL